MMPGRNYSAGDSYRYGFNGKENDNEIYGNGNQYDYGFRIYNPRLGRFLSVDPIAKVYPWYTPYQFAGNKPIVAIDLDGLEEKVAILKYTAVDGSALKLPKDAEIEFSSGLMKNHGVTQTKGQELVNPKNFADFFPKGTVATFSYNGLLYGAAYTDEGFQGYFNSDCNCYWDGPDIWFPNYQPIFNHTEDGIINITDPSGGVIADAFQIADHIETASGLGGALKAISKASIPLLLKAIKGFRDELGSAGKSILDEKATHILQDSHLWDDVIGNANDKFGEVKKIMADVAENGQVILDRGSKGNFGSIVKKVNDKWVEVRFGKKPEGGYRINDGWVADPDRSAQLDDIFTNQ